MIGAVVENLIGAFLSPRASVRRLLVGGHGVDAALLLVLFSFLVREIFVLITPGAQIEGGGAKLAQYLMGLVTVYVSFGFLTVLAYQVGRVFGGRGSFRDAALAIAWWLLAVSILTPLAVPAAVEFREAALAAMQAPDGPVVVPRGALLTLTLVSCLSLWLLASYVAEMHRFRHIWGVLVAVIGLSVPVSLLASSLLPLA